MTIPNDVLLDIQAGVGSTKSAVENVLQSKYNSAVAWAKYGATLLEKDITDLNNLLGTDVIGPNLTQIQSAIDAIGAPPVAAPLTYTAPTAPTYGDVPAFSSPTLGSITAVPAIADLSIGAAPSTDIVFDNPDFSSSLGDTLASKLTTDLSNGGTGLGAATEAALFARETARQNDTRAKAYDEITTRFEAANYDLPPGALLELQTQANNESNIRLSDSSSQIMAESARLAVDFNKTALSSSVQMVDVLARIHDSKVMRAFEAAKITVTMAIEGFKQTVAVVLANADVQKKRVDAVVAANSGVVEVFKAEIAGQVEPMRAISETNQAMASAYRAAVEGEKASLEAQAIPEELKLKAYSLGVQIAESKGRLAESQARVMIEAALRQLTVEAQTLTGMANSAAALVSGALNGVSASVQESWGGSAGSGIIPGEGTKTYGYDADGNLTEETYSPNVTPG